MEQNDYDAKLKKIADIRNAIERNYNDLESELASVGSHIARYDDLERIFVRIAGLSCEIIDDNDLKMAVSSPVEFLAKRYTVKLQDAAEFMRLAIDADDVSKLHGEVGTVLAPCNHKKCCMGVLIKFGTPDGMVKARHRAAHEVWYCHHHWRTAWDSDGALADFMVVALQHILKRPGINKTDVGVSRNALDFLHDIGLIRIVTASGAKIFSYQHYLTDIGAAFLSAWDLPADG